MDQPTAEIAQQLGYVEIDANQRGKKMVTFSRDKIIGQIP